ncbi:hypothetical protein FKM82_012745 [Ascaphus truei]
MNECLRVCLNLPSSSSPSPWREGGESSGSLRSSHAPPPCQTAHLPIKPPTSRPPPAPAPYRPQIAVCVSQRTACQQRRCADSGSGALA